MAFNSIVVAVVLGHIFCCVDGELETLRELKRRNWNTGLDYTGQGDYHKLDGHIGWSNDNWSVRGTGWIDNKGNHGVGASVKYSWRRGLPLPKDTFILRIEANQCQFKTYDDDNDGIITVEDMRSVFPDAKLAQTLFSHLDINDDGEVSEEEFNVKKRLINGCAKPSDDIKE